MELEEHAKSLAKRAKSRVGDTVVAYEVMKWPEGRLKQLVEIGLFRPLPDADEIRCPGCAERHMIVPIRTILPNGEPYSEHLCGKEGLIEIPAFLFKRWQIVIERLIELGYLDEEEDADRTEEPAETEEEDITKTVNSLYLELNLAERTVIVGDRTLTITSDRAWDFLKTLASKRKQQQFVKRVDGDTDWKNARDTLRRCIQSSFGKDVGKILTKRLIRSSKGCYSLDSSVKIKSSASIGIRTTRQKKR